MSPLSQTQGATILSSDAERLSRLNFLEGSLQAVREAVFVTEDNGRLIYLNRAAETLTGWSSNRAVGQRITDIWRIDGAASLSDLTSPKQSLKEGVLLNRAGQQLDVEYTVSAMVSQTGWPPVTILVARDISSRRKRELALQTSEESVRENSEALFAERERAHVTLESIGDAVVSTDFRGHVAYMNKAAERLTGWPQAEAAGSPAGTIFRLIDTETGQPTPCPATEAIIENQRRTPAATCVLIRRDGETVAVEVAATPIHDRVGGVFGAVMVGHDVTAARELSDKLARLALHDHLTDLPNRTLFKDRIDQAITLARRSGTRLSVLYIDLDRFKEINDSLGHLVGDEVLKMAAQRLLECIRASDTVSRQGGDEFLALLIDCSFEESKSCAQKILDALSAPYPIGLEQLSLSASIGIAQYPSDGTEAGALIKAADTAMYVAKCAARDKTKST
jgi:diguanylate cyclase (GGDEF)-like protein/PAS domain S-box-containing protein